MTSPIDAIGAVAGLQGPANIKPIDTTLDIGGLAGTQASQGAGGADFASTLAGSLQQVQDLQYKTDDLSVQAATGSLTDVHDYMIAATESGIATQLTTAVRNKAVEAFQEIMRMQA